MGQFAALTVFISFLLTSICQADYYTSYIWYRPEPEFSRIVITEETLRGHRAVDGFIAKAKEHEKTGKYHNCDYGGPAKKVTKVEKMDGHEIKTEISISHPRGLGFGGAVPDCWIRVFFDGELKVSCPIGDWHPDSLNVAKVIIHAEDQAAEVIYIKHASPFEPAWNFFEDFKETIVLEKGKLVTKPSEPKKAP